jgi:hypothetical protein
MGIDHYNIRCLPTSSHKVLKKGSHSARFARTCRADDGSVPDNEA